jgi:hypothetical protein
VRALASVVDDVVVDNGVDDTADGAAFSDALSRADDERTLAGGFDGGKSSCEIAMTTRERKRARKKRLSIKEPGHSRPAERDDSGEYDQL